MKAPGHIPFALSSAAPLLALCALAAPACSSGQPAAPGTAASDAGGDATTIVTADASGEAVPDSMAPASDSAAPSDASGGDGALEAGGDGGRDLSTDRTKFFGASRCATAGVQLCEGFETGTLNKTTWAVSGTPPVIDGMEHARGAYALHITQNGDGLSYIKETMTFPEPNDTYFGRVFVYFKSLPIPPGMTYAHWTIIAASGTVIPGEIRVSGQLQNGANLFGVGTDNRTDGGTGDWTNSDNDPKGSPAPVPLNQWICLEWMHKGDTNETQLWWDATLHPSLSTTSTVHGGNAVPFLLPQFTNVWLGWQEYQTSTEPFELWMDEIAIDTARIGCVL
jgi:hypothetical protein